MTTETPFTKKYYWMDPETDDLIRGENLETGMTVLIEDPNKRVSDAEIAEAAHNLERAMLYNRWVTVEKIDYDVTTGNIHFIGRYDDGAKRTFITREDAGWFVKLNTLPEPVENDENVALFTTPFEMGSAEYTQRIQAIKAEVRNRVQKAMVKQDSYTFNGNGSSAELDDFTSDIALEIFMIVQSGLQTLNQPTTDPVPTKTDIPTITVKQLGTENTAEISLDELSRRSHNLIYGKPEEN